MKLQIPGFIFIYMLVSSSCNNPTPHQDITSSPNHKGSYGYDAQFLKQHTESIVELSDNSGSKILLSADYQGRVMTSTASGDSGTSFGWINYDLIASGEVKKQFNPVGGEERFWLGPEGGQYSIYFAPGDSFAINKWQVPAIIDTVSYVIKASSATEAIFTKEALVRNYSDELFNLSIERKVSMLSRDEVASALGVDLPEGLRSVGYQTTNQV